MSLTCPLPSHFSLDGTHSMTYRIRKSLDAGSTATLVHTFVTSRVDYCNVVLAESPRSTTDKLNRVMNAAARVISNTQRYDSGLSILLHEELQWLDVIDRVRYKLAVLAYRSLHGTAPLYLTSLLTSASEVAGRQYLAAICCSTETHRSTVPSEDVWLSGVFAGKSGSLECIAGQSERSKA